MSLLILTSCTKIEQVPVLDESKSLLFVQVSDGSKEVHATRTPIFTIGSVDRLLLLQYDLSLDRLGLETGRITAPQGTPGRPVPPGYSAYELVDDRWIAIDATEAMIALHDVRIRSLPESDCFGVGCWRFDEYGGYCEQPCNPPETPPDPAEPTTPDPPIFSDCRIGWEAMEVEGTTVCVTPSPCPGDTVRLLGVADCLEVAGPCPAGRWPEDLPPGPKHYVDPSAPANGDGTLNQPFRTIQAAVSAAADDDQIILAKDRFILGMEIEKRLTLIGACAETHLVGAIGVSGDLTVRQLKLTAQSYHGFGVARGASLSLQQVVIEGSDTHDAIHALGWVETSSVHVIGGRGARLLAGARGSLSTTRFDDNEPVGVELHGDGTDVELRDLWITNTVKIVDDRKTGIGLFVLEGARATFDGLVLQGNQGNAMNVWDARVTGERLVFQEPLGGPGLGLGLDVAYNAVVDVRELFAQGRSTALYVNIGGELNAEDVIIADTPNMGIKVHGGGTLQLSRAKILRSTRSALRLYTCSATLNDVAIEDTQLLDGNFGEGISATDGSEITVSRVSLSRGYGAGLYVRDGRLAGEDVTLWDAQRRVDEPAPSSGFGLLATSSTTIDLLRVQVRNTDGVGIQIDGGAAGRFADLEVTNTTGQGILVHRSRASFERLRLLETSTAGVWVEGGDVTLIDATVANNRNPNDFEDAADIYSFGWTADRETVQMSNLHLSRTDLTARGSCLNFGQFSELTTESVLIHGCRIGLRVGRVGLDPSEALRGILFQDNEQNVAH